MNSIERIIYDKIRFSPKIKNMVVRTYQFLLSIIPIKKVKSGYNIITREGYFFGFHDISPWSHDNKFLLAHEYTNDLIIPKVDDTLNVGYFSDTNFTKFNKIGTTSTWNWQMGSMLQWYGNDIIFNDYENSHHFSRLVDINGKIIKKYTRPIAAVNKHKGIGLSHSFVRMQKVARAYCYANGTDKYKSDNCPTKDGIHLVDLKVNVSKLIYSIAEIAEIDAEDYDDDSYHYFTHCLFNPSRERFAFYHRWVDSNSRTWTRLFTSSSNGKELYHFNFDGVVTHMAWKDDKNLLVYGFKKEIGDHYYLLEDMTDNFKIIGGNQFTSDGHQQFSPDNLSFITDTYPDRFRRQYLLKYNLEEKKREKLAVMKSPLKFSGDVRCDLHPRWDRLGKYISFDSAHTGKRALCTIKIQ